MIELDHIQQGSGLWVDARLGIPTGSEFARVVTATGKFATARDTYLGELCAEYFYGPNEDDFAGNEWTERGKALEPQAFEWYGFNRDLDVRSTGFIYRDEDRMVGCSPDGMVDPDGCLELKCPAPHKHLLWLARGTLPKEHFCQVQGHIWVTGRKWCDFMSYDPGAAAQLIIRVEPDEKYQSALDEHMPAFIEELLEARARLRAQGFEPHREESE